MGALLNLILTILAGGAILFLCLFLYVLNANKEEVWKEIKRRMEDGRN